MRRQRFRFEFGMKLASEKPGVLVARELHDLDKFFVRRNAAEYQTTPLQPLSISGIKLVTMPVTLADFFRVVVNFAGERIFAQAARPGPQPHRPAEVLDVNQVT